MTQKCLKCGAPISGFLGKIAWFAGVKPSKVKSGYCNKCEREAPDVAEDLGTSNQELGTASNLAPSSQPALPDEGRGRPPAPVTVVPPVEKPIPSAPVKDIFDEIGKK